MKLGYFLLLALIAVQYVLLFPSPLSGEEAVTDVLRWAVVESPGETGKVIVSPSEVSKIAVGRSNIIYAIDSENDIVYRSLNAGLSWEDITEGLRRAGATLPAVEVVVAPDTPTTVAVVTDNRRKVYLSNDSGAMWHNTSVPLHAGEIQSIAISTAYTKGSDVVWDLAIGTASWGDNLSIGQVWTLQFGDAISTWKNQRITVDPSIIGADISAVAFSPKYSDNEAIFAIASTGTDVAAAYQSQTWLCIGDRDLDMQTTKWNAAGGFPSYPVAFVSAGDAVGVTGILSDMEMPSNYDVSSSTTRVVFASFNRQPDTMNAGDDVYRFNDTTVNRLNVSGGADIDICSISLYGSLSGSTGTGKLLAGDIYSDATGYAVQVRRCLYPFETTFPWQTAKYPPSGPGNACVSWNYDGTAAYCGTGQLPGVALDESAFSRTYDSGETWEQVSLIDTTLNISDIAPAPDSKSLFMASYSDYGPEGVWRSAGEPMGSFWGRILTVQSDNTTAERIILRLSADYLEDFTLYAIPLGGIKLQVSHTRGSGWTERVMPHDVIDAAVESRDTLYVALKGGKIRKSTDGSKIWQAPVSTGLDEINMLSIPQAGHILAGSRDGRVAYSTDGGETFTKIDDIIGSGTGDVQVVGDANYSENGIIYAATSTEDPDTPGTKTGDEGIWRWVIGSSDEWEQIDETVTSLGNNQQVSGLLTGEEGTLYALRAELSNPGVSGGMSRTLYPYEPEVLDIEFDVVNATIPVGVLFDPLEIYKTIPTVVDPELRELHCHTLPHLKLSEYEGMNCLWALDTAHTVIYRFNDTLCRTGPALSEFDFVGCDPASGRNQEFSLVWEQLSLSDEYEVHIGKDTIFSLRVGQTEPVTNPFYPPPVVTSPAYCIAAAQVLECGHTFYWRIRTRHAITGETIRSPWSIVSDFDVKAGFPVTTEYYGTRLLSPENGCGCPCESPACFSWAPYKETTLYLFELSENSDMSDPLVSDTVSDSTAYQYTKSLKCNTNYFWRVMALEPVESDWSTVFSFMTHEGEMPSMPQREIQTSGTSKTPVWAWVLVALGTIGCTNVLIIAVRRMNET